MPSRPNAVLCNPVQVRKANKELALTSRYHPRHHVKMSQECQCMQNGTCELRCMELCVGTEAQCMQQLRSRHICRRSGNVSSTQVDMQACSHGGKIGLAWVTRKTSLAARIKKIPVYQCMQGRHMWAEVHTAAVSQALTKAEVASRLRWACRHETMFTGWLMSWKAIEHG